jgi:hypothetical protein
LCAPEVESSHRIDDEGFYRMLDGVMTDDARVFNDKLQEWQNFYNYHRPHGGPRRPDTLRATASEDQRGVSLEHHSHSLAADNRQFDLGREKSGSKTSVNMVLAIFPSATCTA